MGHGDRYERLLSGARAGDEDAWRALVQELGTAVLAYLRAQRANEPELLLDEVFLELAHGLHRFDGDAAAFRERAFTITRRRVVHEDRPGSTSGREPCSVDPSEAALIGTVDTKDVHSLLGALGVDEREVILLRVLGDLTLEQTARVVGRRASVVRDLQASALRALRGQLGSGDADAGRSGDQGAPLEVGA